jgi:AraC-like DNA-binding protein
MSRVDIAELARLREERGLTLGQIALRLGVSPGYLAYVCMEHGIQRPGRIFRPGGLPPGTVVKRAGHLVRPFSPAEDTYIQRRRLEGASTTTIGAELGRNQSSIRGRLLTLARYDELGVQR